ncbi:MAG TPA: TIGR01777 family oxidoreductase [Chitinophagaceae bacterium]|nr:TIGR01777 family oxidoreductase [Chitinophagaceae bacterium]
MKNKKIIIAGGTGFIGEEMIRYFGKDNDIVVLTRQTREEKNNRNRYHSLGDPDMLRTRYVKWDGQQVTGWENELNGSDLIINLAGKSVNCRYTPGNKQKIFDSRTDAVKTIGAAIRAIQQPPPLWVNASSATIYRHAMDRPQDEETGEFHNDFSVQVCKRWEQTYYEQSTPGTRKVALRMAITLGPGGILLPFFNLLKFGLGGRQGSGKQMFSWIHAVDLCRMIVFLEENTNLEGTFNASSPNPVSNAEFMQTLRKLSSSRIGLPASAWMLKIGAALIGTELELILKSRWVLPTRMIREGFQFRYPVLKDALQEIFLAVPTSQYRFF